MTHSKVSPCRALSLGIAAAAALATVSVDVTANAQQQQQRAARNRAGEATADLHWWPVRKNIWMLVGAGANIAASVGPDGVMLVNAGNAQSSERVLAAIRDLQTQLNAFGFLDVTLAQRGGAETRSRFPVNTHAPPKPVRYIIDTNSLPHSVGGNEALAKAGVTYSGGNVAGTIADSAVGAAVLAHENVLNRLVAQDLPFDALPTETFFMPDYKISTFFNDEGVQIIHVPNGTTDGDSIVWFRGSDVIAAGDVFNMDSFPIIDVDAGGSINGVLASLNTILKLAVPEFRTEGGTMIVPGHGRLGDSADVGYYRDMLTVIRDQIKALIDEGLTLEQVIERRPTFGYEGRFGKDTGPWTTQMFIEAAYRSLKENS
jgi:glyoxylase-like metal-dependent hydrolase (beta-lactamase superfamily II)